MIAYSPADIAAKRARAAETMANIRADLTARHPHGMRAPMFAHLGFFRATPRSQPGPLLIRFNDDAPGLVGARVDGAIWESIEVVPG